MYIAYRPCCQAIRKRHKYLTLAERKLVQIVRNNPGGEEGLGPLKTPWTSSLHLTTWRPSEGKVLYSDEIFGHSDQRYKGTNCKAWWWQHHALSCFAVSGCGRNKEEVSFWICLYHFDPMPIFFCMIHDSTWNVKAIICHTYHYKPVNLVPDAGVVGSTHGCGNFGDRCFAQGQLSQAFRSQGCFPKNHSATEKLSIAQ